MHTSSKTRSHWDKLPNDMIEEILFRKAKLEYNDVVKELNCSLVEKVNDNLIKKSQRFLDLYHTKFHEIKGEYTILRKGRDYIFDFNFECIKFLEEFGVQFALFLPHYETFIKNENQLPYNNDEKRIFENNT